MKIDSQISASTTEFKPGASTLPQKTAPPGMISASFKPMTDHQENLFLTGLSTPESSSSRKVTAGSKAQNFNAQQVHIHTGKLLMNYPQCVASNERVFVVKHDDGRYRSIPNDSGSLNHLKSGNLPREAIPYLKACFDAPEDYVAGAESFGVSMLTAGFHFDATDKTFQFKLPKNRKGDLGSQASISPRYDIFPIGNNRYMIRQPTTHACSYACEEMLLSEGKTEAEVIQQVEARFKEIPYKGRNMGNVLQSINQRRAKGTKAYEIINGAASSFASVNLIRDIMAKADGPALFASQSHARILDGIVESDSIVSDAGEHFFAAVRDPFTSNCVLTLARDIFRSHERSTFVSKGSEEVNWQVIYKPK